MEDVVGAVNGGSTEVSIRALAGGLRGSSSVRSLPSSGVGVGSAPTPGGSLVGMMLKDAPVAAPCKPKIVLVPVANTEDSDMVHSAPSDSNRAARGLGPLAITICKPLAFRVSANTEQEIIHNSSVFESHGLICRRNAGPLQQILKPSGFMMSYLFETEAFTLVEDSVEAKIKQHPIGKILSEGF
ncbi:hypothetical protein SUGI_0507350 [Cryptomeria japonica]|nr:hypothetical protein SUGI_0507350 [Cryptomeria japonica]